MNRDLRQFYTGQVSALKAEITALRRYNSTFIVAELLAFAAMTGSLVAFTITDLGFWLLLLAAVFVVVYFVLRRVDALRNGRADERERMQKVYQRELSYLDGDYSCFDAGDKYTDPRHAFTYDLDIFGRQSLFQRINRTVTTGGSDYLAALLSRTTVPQKDDILRRREAVGELAENERLRTAFLAHGCGQQIPTDAIREALQEVRNVHIPRLALSWLSYVCAMAGILMFYGLLLGALFGPLSGSVPFIWAVLQIVAVYFFFGRSLKQVSHCIDVILPPLDTYINMIIGMVETGFKSAELRAIIRQLSVDDQDAVGAFRQLKGIVGNLDSRNELWVPLSNALYMADYFIVRRYLKWQDRYMMCIDDWIEAVSHFDALVSMATFRYNEQQAVDAEISDADAVEYEAAALYHPFLGAKAVRNDFSITDGHYYIITGANMAGKSTFLRSVGINYVLALCGMPVFAERLRVSLFSLFSSMRTTDDLAHGISYFNAELLRLQQLLQYCRRNKHTLIILDEILKGTNSLDKLNGSRLFLESVSQLPVTGIVATHDLELSKMADKQSDRFHNYCFEIQLSDEITYTYHITEGVARNQNATYLLKHILTAADQ